MRGEVSVEVIKSRENLGASSEKGIQAAHVIQMNPMRIAKLLHGPR